MEYPAGTYYYNDGVSTTNSVYMRVYDNTSGDTIRSGAGSFTLTKKTNVRLRVYIKGNPGTVDLTFRPMLVTGGTGGYTYETYNGEIITIPFQTTQYGGTIDVLNGVLTVNTVFIELDGDSDVVFSNHGEASSEENYPYWCTFNLTMDGNLSSDYTSWRFSHGLCQQGAYAGIWRIFRGTTSSTRKRITVTLGINTDFTDITDVKTLLAAQKANNTPLQIVAALETPITIQLTPAELSLLVGYNYVYSDSNSNITMKYGEAINSLDAKIDRQVEAINNRKVNNKAFSSDVTLSAEDLQYDSTLSSHTSGSIGKELADQATTLASKAGLLQNRAVVEFTNFILDQTYEDLATLNSTHTTGSNKRSFNLNKNRIVAKGIGYTGSTFGSYLISNTPKFVSSSSTHSSIIGALADSDYKSFNYSFSRLIARVHYRSIRYGTRTSQDMGNNIIFTTMNSSTGTRTSTYVEATSIKKDYSTFEIKQVDLLATLPEIATNKNLAIILYSKLPDVDQDITIEFFT